MHRQFPRTGLLFLLLITNLFVSCGGGSSGGSDNPPALTVPATWTYMVYLAANNSLSDYGIGDLNEMEKVGSSNDVNIVVQAEFSSNLSSTIRGRVVHDENMLSVGSWYTGIGNKDMTDPATLTDFIVWAAQTYPADHYALVLWSHGGGWKTVPVSSIVVKGMITDGSNQVTGTMPLPDLANAVRQSGIVFDVINFDTCLMAMYEVAYEFKGLASYLAFSEREYPVDGDPYDVILQELVNNPAMDGAQLAQTIVTKSVDFYQAAGMNVTKSLAVLAGIEQFNTDLSALAGYLSDHMAGERDHIDAARLASVPAAGDYPENHDLQDFLEALDGLTSDNQLKSLIDQALQSMAQVIVINGLNKSQTDTTDILESHGLAIYLPSASETDDSILGQYELLKCSQASGDTWYDFVYAFTQN